MKTGVLIVVGWLMAGLCFGDPKCVSTVEETNSWSMAVANAELGLQQDMGRWSITRFYSSNAVTNGFIYLEADPVFHARCYKEHFEDYPKTNEQVYGVQFLKTYESKTKIDGEKVVTKWSKYTYPHRKITVTTLEELKRVTTVTTNDVKVCKESK